MARRTPAVDRTVAVLNHLAVDPGARVSLSELARELDLSKATAHALLASLVDHGYVVRDPSSKAYALGPALVALGNAASSANPAAQLAAGPMAAVSRDLDLECVASTAIADEIVILATSGEPRPLGINIQPGLRLPLVPPLGTVFVAWSGSEVIDRWLGTLGPDVDPPRLARYRQALEAVRARGYSVGLGGDEQQQLVASLQGEESHPTATAPGEEYALVELAESTPYRLNHVGAPVFDAAGRVAIALFLIGFRGQIPASDVPAYAERLVAAAEEVTVALGGRSPRLSSARPSGI